MPDIEAHCATLGLTYAARNLFASAEEEAEITQRARANPPAPFSLLHYRPLSAIDIVMRVMHDLPRRQHPQVEVRASGAAGEGLFASAEIPKGTFVGEYTGRIVIVPQTEVRAISDSNDYLFALGLMGPFERHGVLVQAFIDARPAGNHTRFANHAEEPNCASGSVLLDDGWHVFLATNRDVAAGEQLLYDYGANYWRTRTPPLAL